MSGNNRRPHIGLRARRIKKLPYFKTEEEKEEEEIAEKVIFRTDSSILQNATKLVLDDKNKREEKNNLRIENELFFIINLHDKVSWRKTYDRMKNLPIKIKEILDDYTIEVKLKREDYDNFYYSLEDLNDLIKDIKQIDINNKIHPDLLKELIEKENEKGIYSIELFDISKTGDFNEFESLFIKYVKGLNSDIKKIFESEYDVLYILNIINKELIKIIETLDSITRVEKEPETFLNMNSDELNFIVTDYIKSQPSEDIQKICIIDSGINKDHRKLSSAVYDTFDFTTNTNDPCDDTIPHGSCVAGLAAYGEDPNTATNPSAVVIMIKNYIDKRTTVVNNITAIQRTLEIYGDDFKIMNLSFSSDRPNIGFSRALDKITFNNNLITVASAGNIPVETIKNLLHQGLTYPNYLKQFPIYFPGDCRNVITVGGCTHLASNLAPNNAPSPFTKVNSFVRVVKPDVVEKAGNLAYEGNSENIISDGYGLLTTSNYESTYIERQGTSFSAPIVSNLIARLMNSLKIENPALLKALLLSSCRHLIKPNKEPYDYDIQGFGKPYMEYAEFSHTWRANYLLEGRFNSREPWHRDRYQIWFPQDADTLAVTLVCEKSQTLYREETLDNVRFRVESRAGTSGTTAINSLLGERYCFHTYKGEFNVERGSRGLWQVEIVPQFSSRYYMDLQMRYGCILTVEDSSRQEDVWGHIYESWMEAIIGEYTISKEEESLGLLKPQILTIKEDAEIE